MDRIHAGLIRRADLVERSRDPLPVDVPAIWQMTRGGDGNLWATLDHPPCIGFEGFNCSPPNPPPFGVVRVDVHGLPHRRATAH